MLFQYVLDHHKTLKMLKTYLRSVYSFLNYPTLSECMRERESESYHQCAGPPHQHRTLSRTGQQLQTKSVPWRPAGELLESWAPNGELSSISQQGPLKTPLVSCLGQCSKPPNHPTLLPQESSQAGLCGVGTRG